MDSLCHKHTVCIEKVCVTKLYCTGSTCMPCCYYRVRIQYYIHVCQHVLVVVQVQYPRFLYIFNFLPTWLEWALFWVTAVPVPVPRVHKIYNSIRLCSFSPSPLTALRAKHALIFESIDWSWNPFYTRHWTFDLEWLPANRCAMHLSLWRKIKK